MTLEEKIKMIEESKNKKYLLISPRRIQSGATLIGSNETLELYENMDTNTSKFAEKEIITLIARAKHNNQETKKYLDLKLFFCGDFDDLPKDLGNPINFIINNKEKIVAVYKYVRETKTKEYFIGFAQTETINKYGYLYLSLEKLLKSFEENNIQYEIDTTVDRYTPSMYRDDTITKFLISYNPKKELESDKGYSLKKVKKEGQ